MVDLRVVVDTSVFVAGYLTKNPDSSSALIISIWRNGGFKLVWSPQLLEELAGQLLDKGIPEELVLDLIRTIGKIGLYIPGAYEATRLDHVDPKDNMFLAAAYESRAHFLVSTDKKHILPLKHFHGTHIVHPSLFLRTILSR